MSSSSDSSACCGGNPLLQCASGFRSAWRVLTIRNIGRFFISPLFLAFNWFVAGLYTNSVLQIVADRQVVHCGEDVCPPLPDLGHQLFPHLTFVTICDYWLYFAVGSTLLRFSPIFVSKSLSLVLLRRWLFLQGALFWMRGISVALTRQSVPQEDCVTTALGNAWIEGFYIMSGVHITCGDIMYSGHTAGISLCTLIWTHYSRGEEWKPCCGDARPFITPNLDAVGDPATCSLTACIAWVFAFTGFFFIIATHFHYSNDVFIGLIITQFVFRIYHYYIKTVLELPGWWAKFFRWFEGFDISLLAQMGEKDSSLERGLLTRKNSSTGLIRGASYDDGRMSHASSMGTKADLETGGAAARAAQNAGGRNRDQAVAPLAGVAVAVFSEGPDKAAKQNADNEAKFGRHGVVGEALKGKEGAEKDSRIRGSAGVSGAGVVHSSGGGHSGPSTPTSSDYHYHAMPDTGAGHPTVVVAGEIAEQEQERKETEKGGNKGGVQ